MAITIRDDLPEFLVKWLEDRGAVAVVDDKTGNPGVVPLGKKRRRKTSGEDTFTSSDMDVDPAADIQFDPSFLNNIIGNITGLFNTSKGNTELSDIQELSYGSLDKPTDPFIDAMRLGGGALPLDSVKVTQGGLGDVPVTRGELYTADVLNKKDVDRAKNSLGGPSDLGRYMLSRGGDPRFDQQPVVNNEVRAVNPRGGVDAGFQSQVGNAAGRDLGDYPILDFSNNLVMHRFGQPEHPQWNIRPGDNIVEQTTSAPRGMFSRDRDFSYGPSLPASVSQAVPGRKPTNPVQEYIETNQAQAKDGWKFNDNTGLDRAGRSFQNSLVRGGTDFLYDPNLTGGEKMGFGLSKLAPSILSAAGVAGAPLIGLFGAIGQAMGGYHPLNQASNIFMDPFVGTSRWESPEAGGGGAQTGILNLDNQIENLAQSDPGRYVKTPYGYITAGELNNAIKSGALHFGADEFPTQVTTEDMGFRQDTPFMLQDVANSNVTNQRAVQDLANTNAGAFLNRAAELLPDAGYNEIRDVAEGMSQVAQITDNMSNIYDFDFDYGDLGIEGLAGIEDSASDSFDDAYADSFSDTTMDSFDEGGGWF